MCQQSDVYACVYSQKSARVLLFLSSVCTRVLVSLSLHVRVNVRCITRCLFSHVCARAHTNGEGEDSTRPHTWRESTQRTHNWRGQHTLVICAA